MSEEDEKVLTDKESPTKKASTKKKSSTKTKKTAKKVSPIRRPRVYRFEQWATRRGIPKHHRGGLQAYVKDVHKPRSLEDWDACFKDY